ncbi:hypothetical protein JL720_13719 [Aureococcus anophagefferens]|nr:hypothetical protein JL720_13719 [Aureococcus anophagefferens]
MVDGALARPGGDDAAARRSRQARVEYLCVSLCRAVGGAADDAVMALVARRPAAPRGGGAVRGRGLGPAAAAAGLPDRRAAAGLSRATPPPGAAGDADAPAWRRWRSRAPHASLRADGALRRSRAARRTALLRGDLEVRDARCACGAKRRGGVRRFHHDRVTVTGPCTTVRP